jgi:hypothetical protein
MNMPIILELGTLGHILVTACGQILEDAAVVQVSKPV